MRDNLIAQASTTAHAPVSKVWDALTNPSLIKRYMFGTTVKSDWRVGGGPITRPREWERKRYEDKGAIEQLKPEQPMLLLASLKETLES